MANILKEIYKKEQAIKENLLLTSEVQPLYDELVSYLGKELPFESLPGLRFRKLQAKRVTWWSDTNGFPFEKPWPKFQPMFDLLAQHEAEKTIKHRLEVEGLFIESRSRDEDQHLIVGGSKEAGIKAHIIIDGKTGEIRVEDNQQEPTELFSKIETVLTLPSGQKVKTTREAIELMPQLQ